MDNIENEIAFVQDAVTVKVCRFINGTMFIGRLVPVAQSDDETFFVIDPRFIVNYDDGSGVIKTRLESFVSKEMVLTTSFILKRADLIAIWPASEAFAKQYEQIVARSKLPKEQYEKNDATAPKKDSKKKKQSSNSETNVVHVDFKNRANTKPGMVNVYSGDGPDREPEPA